MLEALRAVADTRESGPQLGINTVISAVNLDSLEPLLRWAQAARHIDSIYFMAVMRPFGSEEGWDWHEKEEWRFLWPDPDRACERIDGLIAAGKDGKLGNPEKAA